MDEQNAQHPEHEEIIRPVKPQIDDARSLREVDGELVQCGCPRGLCGGATFGHVAARAGRESVNAMRRGSGGIGKMNDSIDECTASATVPNLDSAQDSTQS